MSSTLSDEHVLNNVAFEELPEDLLGAGMSSTHQYLLCLSSSTLLAAGPAAAHGDAANTLLMQQAVTQGAEQQLSTLFLADFSLLPSFNGLPFQIAGFLLNHPFITLGLALGVNYVVPRAFRAAVRFLVIPLVLGGFVWLALQNPSTAWGLFRGAFDCEHLSCPHMRSISACISCHGAARCMLLCRAYVDSSMCTVCAPPCMWTPCAIHSKVVLLT